MTQTAKTADVVPTSGPWQTKHDYSLEGRATIIANVDGEIIEGSNHYTYDTVAICADEFGEYLPNAAENARLIVSACNSYQRHFYDPITAAESDWIARAVEAMEALHSWLLCYPIASDADMAQNFPEMTKLVDVLLSQVREVK